MAAVVILLACAAIWGLLRGQPGPQRLALTVHENLVAAFGQGEIFRTTTGFAAGSAKSLRYSAEAPLRQLSRTHGFRSRPDAEPPFAWLVGERPSFRLDVVAPRDRELRLLLASAVGPGQRVEVAFNDDVVGAADLPPEGESWVSVEVPAATQVRGSNRVELRFARAEPRPLDDEPVDLPLAASLRAVRFGREPFVEGVPAAGIVEAPDGERTLVLPASTCARIGLAVPEGERALLRATVGRAAVPFEISVLTDEGDVSVLASTGPLEEPTELEVDMTPWLGQTVLLEVRTVEAAGGALEIGPAVLLATPADESPAVEPRLLERPSFLVVVFDALGRRRVSGYGHPRWTTPNLDRLMASSVVFEQAVAPASRTAPSVASLLTGMPGRAHGLRPAGPDGVGLLDGQTPRLARALQRAGWRTAAVVAHPGAAAAHGFDAGFESYDELYRDDEHWDEGVSGADVVAAVERRLADFGDEPFLLYAHVFEPHAPWDPPEELRRAYAPPYDGDVSGSRAWLDAWRAGGLSITARDWTHLHRLHDARVAQADAVLGALLARLEWAGRADDTVVVVTSAHGEAVGAHGVLEHGETAYGEEIDVPLVLHVPGIRPDRRPGLATLADLAPTLLGLAAVDPAAAGTDDGPAPGHMEGRGLLRPLPRDRGHLAVGGTFLSWTRDRWRLVVDLATRRRELYDCLADPLEQHDRSADRPAVAALMHRQLVDAVCRDLELIEAGGADDDLLRRLSSVGDCCGPDLPREAGEPLGETLGETWCRRLRLPLKRL